MKTRKLGLVIVFFLLGFAGYSQKQSLEWIPFQWEGATISGQYIEKAFIYIPLKIDNLPQEFTMQLDLGTQNTQFYGNTIKPYLEAYPALANKLDTVHFGTSGVLEDMIFRDIDLKMGTADFPFDVWHRHNFRDVIPTDSLHTQTPKHIGTVAPDLFRNKILIIDYPGRRFAVTDNLPAEYANLPAVEFESNGELMVLPFRIDGKESKLMFDTGSSPFPLATSKERALEISDGVIVDSLSGPLWWGRDITFYGLKVNKPIEFGGQVLENSTVYYDKEGLWEEGVFKPQQLWGLTGNAYFLDRVAIIDYKNKLFRIK